jgi:hypothetical protein
MSDDVADDKEFEFTVEELREALIRRVFKARRHANRGTRWSDDDLEPIMIYGTKMTYMISKRRAAELYSAGKLLWNRDKMMYETPETREIVV